VIIVVAFGACERERGRLRRTIVVTEGATMPVGIIGLGEMGLAMATRLVATGHTVVGYDPSPRAAAAAAAIGVSLRDSPAAATADGDLAVLINVRTEGQLASASSGPDGAVAAAKGRSLVMMSTVNPRTVEALATQAHDAGGVVVDAPHTGSWPAAEKGQLVVWIAGADAAITPVRPVIEALASRIHVIGPRPGMAQAVKLVNAMGLAISLSAITEMQQFAEVYGVDRELVLRVIDGCSGSSWVSSAMPGVTRTLQEHNINNLHKDLLLAMVETTAAGIDMPVTSATMQSIRHTWPRRDS
jgi:3-hydroxyisobutyrate dehydrogenase